MCNISRRKLMSALAAAGPATLLPRTGFGQDSIPWTPEALGERIWLDWRVDDLPEGIVGSWRDRVGGVTASQSDATQRPTRNSEGLHFDGGPRRLIIPAQSNAYLAHRATLLIFKADFSNCPSGQGSFAAFNGVDGSATSRQPALLYDSSLGCGSIIGQWRDATGYWGGSSALETNNLWHVLLTRRVGGTVYTSLDGGTEMASGNGVVCLSKSGSTTGYIGDFRNTGPVWTMDCLMALQDELGIEDAQRLIGWAMWRKGAQARLPDGHPYKAAPPTVPSSVSEAPYVEATADQWTATQAYWDSTNISNELEQRMGSALDLGGYELKFQDDFTSFSVTHETTGAGPWYSPVHPSATGAARTAQLTDSPPPFVQSDSELIIRMQQGPKGWQSGVMTSVNLNGKGNSWLYGYFEMRARASTGNGYGAWPAFWLKTVNEFFRLTETRVEIDCYEGYASDPKGHHQSFHNWPAARLIPGRVSKHRYVSNYTGLEEAQWGSNVNLFDNQYHTYGVSVESDWIVYYFDRRELARFPTPPEAKKPLFILVDLALNPSEASRAIGISEVGIDYIRVYQRSASFARSIRRAARTA